MLLAPAFVASLVLPARPSRIALGTHRNRLVLPAVRRSPARLPPTAATASPTNALCEGLLLLVQLSSNRRRLVRALRPDGKRNWLVEDAAGQAVSIAPKQVLFTIGHPSTAPDLKPPLSHLDAIATARAADVAAGLEDAWELVAPDEEPVSLDFLADILLGDSSPLACYAAHLALDDDPLYFKSRIVKGVPQYEPRKPSLVAEARVMLEVTQARENARRLRNENLRSALSAGDVEAFRDALSDDAVTAEQALLALAPEADSTPPSPTLAASASAAAFAALHDDERALARDILEAVNLPITPDGALSVLIGLGLVPRHVNLALRKTDLPHKETLGPAVETAVENLLECGAEGILDKDVENRVDLTHLVTFAVDSADTSEIDDAFSWDADSRRIFVHIADPTRYFPSAPNDIIVQAALRRASTLYLPYAKLTMFPEQLASQMLSLGAPLSDGSALSFSFQILDTGALADDSMQITPSRITDPTRFTYEQAEAAISDPTHPHYTALAALHDLAIKRREWREMEGGAIIINTPICDVRVTDPDTDQPGLTVCALPTDTSSWTLVAELMITACSVAASKAVTLDLPVPFRVQEAFDYPPDEVLEAAPDGPVRAALAFRNASPSEMSTTPGEHASLGLDAYLQVTSPIRRATDFISHLQLKAALRGGEPPFDESEIGTEISRTQPIGRSLRGVESRTNRYWQLEHLRRMGNAVHAGTFVKPFGRDGENSRLGVIHLDEFGFTVTAEAVGGLTGGDQVNVEIVHVNPRSNSIRALARRGAADARKLAEKVSDTMDEVMSLVTDDDVSDLIGDDHDIA